MRKNDDRKMTEEEKEIRERLSLVERLHDAEYTDEEIADMLDLDLAEVTETLKNKEKGE